MIFSMEEKFLGTLLKDARTQTDDPKTGKRYTLEGVGELLGVALSTISKWEHNESVPDVEVINLYARHFPLHLTVNEMCRAIGYEVAPSVLKPIEQSLLQAFDQLPHDQKELMLGQVQVVAERLRQRKQ